MTPKKILPYLFIGLSSILASAQTPKCGSTEMLRNRIPGYSASQGLGASIRAAQSENSTHSKTSPVYTIRVVVHVLESDSSMFSPTDVQIKDIIKNVSEDFSFENNDLIGARKRFRSLAGDAGIRFQLADRDPDGNPTSGITRKHVSVGVWMDGNDPFANSMKYDSLGGTDPWDQTKYLNVWVCGLAPGLGGFATYPPIASDPNLSSDWYARLQGVVLNNIPMLVEEKGYRSVTHEFGHYLGLIHPWGDDGSGCLGENDFIDDTPPENGPIFDCDTTINTCADLNPGFDEPDMLENYMDYSPGTCRVMFTAKQAAVMRDMLLQYRPDNIIASATTGFSNGLTTFSLGVYPNPASDKLDLRFENGFQPDVTLVYDFAGRLVKELKTPATTLSVEALDPGLYFIVAQGRTGTARVSFMKR